MTTFATAPRQAGRRAGVVAIGLWTGVLLLAGFVGRVQPLEGAVLDGLLIVWLAVLARPGSQWADAAAGLSLVPLLRLLGLAMPIAGVPAVDTVLLVVPPFAIAVWLVARDREVTARAAGIRMPADLVTSVAVIAGSAIAGVLLASVARGSLAWGVDANGSVPWLRLALYALLIATVQEVTFRGVLPVLFERDLPDLGPWLASAAWTVLAVGSLDPWWLVVTLVTGIVNTLAVARTRSVLPVIIGQAAFLLLLNR
jgi:hypothetical protein